MLASNTILQSRYRVVRKLGEGGMGAVYEAIDQRVSCIVALKETLASHDREARQAFEREASLLANLRHPALPKVMDYFSENEGDFLVMEFIPGNDLAELLELRGNPFRQAQVLSWADDILRVLEYLHGQQPPILHRDIKPSNLKLTKQGEIFLLDFGLAKGSLGQMRTQMTSRSVYGYTPVYASLEQIHGQGTDPRSDLYSVGATLYHLLAGVAPQDAPSRYNATEEDKPDPLKQLEEANPLVASPAAAVIHRAMSVSRKSRFSSATEMRQALRSAMEDAEERSSSSESEQSEASHRRQGQEVQRQAEAEAARRAAEDRAVQEAETRKEEEARKAAERRRLEEEQAARQAEEEAKILEDEERVAKEAAAQREAKRDQARQLADAEQAARLAEDQARAQKTLPVPPPKPFSFETHSDDENQTALTDSGRRIRNVIVGVVVLAVVLAGAAILFSWLKGRNAQVAKNGPITSSTVPALAAATPSPSPTPTPSPTPIIPRTIKPPADLVRFVTNEPSFGAPVYVKEVDLNGDGVPELLAEYEHPCGSGGCGVHLFRRTGSSFKEISGALSEYMFASFTDEMGTFTAGPDMTKGYLNLNYRYKRDKKGRGENFKFDGREYQPTR